MPRTPQPQMNVKFLDSILNLQDSQFDSLVGNEYPFLSFSFLSALEKSMSVCADTGWQPNHLTLWKDDNLIAFMPLYIKKHSYGEYVFDFQWANAYHQSGLNYYPKLLSAIPFTPCAGPRILAQENFTAKEKELIETAMFKSTIEYSKDNNYSSFHYLFPEKLRSRRSTTLLKRIGIQYHWYNSQYESFDDFLKNCKMKARKSIRRERKSICQSEVVIETVEGRNITNVLWENFYHFYCTTYAKRSGNYGYLNQTFFNIIGQTMADQIMMKVAKKKGETIAISLFFKDSSTLYGRYWGCSEEVEFLHFELCYYQGIDYCIEKNLKHFDAGAQGEHKIKRGFKPIETTSYHWINDVRFKDAISNFLLEEKAHSRNAINELSKSVPFKVNEKKPR